MMIALPFLLFAAASGASAPAENGQVAHAGATAAVPNALNPPAKTTAQVQAQVTILRAAIIRHTPGDSDMRETDRSYQRRNAQMIVEFY